MQQLTLLPASFWSGNKTSQIFVTMLSWNWESIVVPGTNVASSQDLLHTLSLVPRLPYLSIRENDGIQQDISSAIRYKLFRVCGKTADRKNNKALFKVAGLKHTIAGQPSHLSKLPVTKENRL